MWHIFTSTNNTKVIKQCIEKETTSLSNFLLAIKLNYLHDLKIMFQCLLHLNMYMYVWLNPDFLSELKTTSMHVFLNH